MGLIVRSESSEAGLLFPIIVLFSSFPHLSRLKMFPQPPPNPTSPPQQPKDPLFKLLLLRPPQWNPRPPFRVTGLGKIPYSPPTHCPSPSAEPQFRPHKTKQNQTIELMSAAGGPPSSPSPKGSCPGSFYSPRFPPSLPPTPAGLLQLTSAHGVIIVPPIIFIPFQS